MHLALVNAAFVASYDELFRVIYPNNNRSRKAVHQLAISYMGLTYHTLYERVVSENPDTALKLFNAGPTYYNLYYGLTLS
jgi:hypothetical protein